MEKRLNLDIAGTISEFEKLTKGFQMRRLMYRIIFRGKGLEFESYREFTPDDGAPDIDWKASARANKLLVKQYIEERDLKIMFVIDVSENMVFGSTEKLKCEYAAELSAALANLILESNDGVGFVLFNDKIVKSVMPKKGKKQFSLFIDSLSNPEVYEGISDPKKALDSLLDLLGSSINAVIIISDFIRAKKDIDKTLDLLSSKFETIAIMIKDPLDKTLPKIKGEVVIQDPLTKEQIIINPDIARKEYEKNAQEQAEMIKKIFTDYGIDWTELTTDKPIAPNLAEFLKERMRKKRYIVPRR